MKETRMPPAHATNLVANRGNAVYRFWVIEFFIMNVKYEYGVPWAHAL